MKTKELKHVLRVGTVVKSEIQGMQGVVSKVTIQASKDGVTSYIRFDILWMDAHTSAAYQHENSFEVMYEPPADPETETLYEKRS